MKVLVTGGAGFLGSHLVDALVARNFDVTVLDNLSRGRPEHVEEHLASNRITMHVADVRDYQSVADAMSGAAVVYHLAAQSNVMGAMQDMDYSFTSNVVGTFNVLKAASSHNVRRVIFASSREVYGEPALLPVSEAAPLNAKNPYGASKVAAEVYCRVWQQNHGLECLILRFANLYGPRDRDRVIPIWLERARRGQSLELYGGDQVLDFLWVGYAVQALLAGLECSTLQPINVGSGQAVTLTQLAGRIVDLVGTQSSVQLRPARTVEVVRFVADVSAMRRVLSVHPSADSLAHLGAMVQPEAVASSTMAHPVSAPHS